LIGHVEEQISRATSANRLVSGISKVGSAVPFHMTGAPATGLPLDAVIKYI
jgi:hypothetical protein